MPRGSPNSRARPELVGARSPLGQAQDGSTALSASKPKDDRLPKCRDAPIKIIGVPAVAAKVDAHKKFLSGFPVKEYLDAPIKIIGVNSRRGSPEKRPTLHVGAKAPTPWGAKPQGWRPFDRLRTLRLRSAQASSKMTASRSIGTGSGGRYERREAGQAPPLHRRDGERRAQDAIL